MDKRRYTGPLGALTSHMSRRRALLALGGAAAQLPLSKPSAPAETAAMPARGASAARSGVARPRAGMGMGGTGQPNIILTITADLDAGALEWMPNISALLRQQETPFADFYASNPSSGPARAAVLRGQYVHNHGMLSKFFTSDNGSFAGEHRLSSRKGLPYDASLRLPLLVRGPGGIPGRIECSLAGESDPDGTVRWPAWRVGCPRGSRAPGDKKCAHRSA